MPHTPSAFKRMRQNARRRLANRDVMSGIRTVLKKALAAIKGADAAKTKAELRSAVRQLDKASAKRVLHPNTAARRKSRLMRMAASAKKPA